MLDRCTSGTCKAYCSICLEVGRRSLFDEMCRKDPEAVDVQCCLIAWFFARVRHKFQISRLKGSYLLL